MVARFWSARTTRERAPSYARHFRDRVLPAIREIDGFGGAMLFERDGSDDVEIVVVTFWQSLDAIGRFAGPDIDGAVVDDEAAAVLVDFDRRVRHYRLAASDGLVPGNAEGSDRGAPVR